MKKKGFRICLYFQPIMALLIFFIIILYTKKAKEVVESLRYTKSTKVLAGILAQADWAERSNSSADEYAFIPRVLLCFLLFSFCLLYLTLTTFPIHQIGR